MSIRWHCRPLILATIFIAVLAARDGSAADPKAGSPRAVALAFVKAVESGDGNTAHRLSVKNERADQTLDAVIDFYTAVNKLQAAATQTFGDRSVDVTANGLISDCGKSIEEADITEENDSAVIAITKPQPAKFCLTRVDGKWKVNLVETLKDLSLTTDSNTLSFPVIHAGVTRTINQIADEISQGKYATSTDAADALQTNMLAAAKAAVPTSQPTNIPATQPNKA